MPTASLQFTFLCVPCVWCEWYPSILASHIPMQPGYMTEQSKLHAQSTCHELSPIRFGIGFEIGFGFAHVLHLTSAAVCTSLLNEMRCWPSGPSDNERSPDIRRSYAQQSQPLSQKLPGCMWIRPPKWLSAAANQEPFPARC